MTINIMYDKTFAKKSAAVLLLILLFVGTYKYAYKKGLSDMATYIINLQDQPKVGDDETYHGSTR